MYKSIRNLALFSSLVLSAPTLAACGHEEQDAHQPSAQPAPMLERISQETQALYESVRPGLVRVQLPVSKMWAQIADKENPLNRWDLDPKVREALAAGQNLADMKTVVTPSTQPTTQPTGGTAEAPATQPGNPQWKLTMVQRPDGGIDFVSPNDAPREGVIGAIVAPRTLAVVYDNQGHIVVPQYIAKDEFQGQGPLPVVSLAGGATVARFVGSDLQTNITVLKLDQPLGRVAPFSGTRPNDGSLVLALAQGGEGGRLTVWTRTQQDRAVVIDVEGRIAGFARLGQFLDTRLAKPVIDQLIRDGRVTRATLGVLVTESEAPDGRRAMHVDQVSRDTAAHIAGVRQGDYILSVAGIPVDDLPNFAAAISTSRGPTMITILRGGEQLDVQVMLEPK